MAVLASKAWMPRKSSFSASGGVVQVCQVAPSSLGRMGPLVPLAQAIPLPRAWMPRRLAVVWESWICHWALRVVAARRRRARRCMGLRILYLARPAPGAAKAKWGAFPFDFAQGQD